MPETRCSLGATIRTRRIELGLSQEQLAERISTNDEYVRQSEISRIESGRVQLPRRKRLELLAAALDLPLGELLAHSGWAGADQAFDNQPVVWSAHRPAAAAIGHRNRRNRHVGDRQVVYPGTTAYRTQGPLAQSGTAAPAPRFQHIREATLEIESIFERSRHELEIMRRQFIESDLRTGTT